MLRAFFVGVARGLFLCNKNIWREGSPDNRFPKDFRWLRERIDNKSTNSRMKDVKACYLNTNEQGWTIFGESTQLVSLKEWHKNLLGPRTVRFEGDAREGQFLAIVNDIRKEEFMSVGLLSLELLADELFFPKGDELVKIYTRSHCHRHGLLNLISTPSAPFQGGQMYPLSFPWAVVVKSRLCSWSVTEYPANTTWKVCWTLVVNLLPLSLECPSSGCCCQNAWRATTSSVN